MLLPPNIVPILLPKTPIPIQRLLWFWIIWNKDGFYSLICRFKKSNPFTFLTYTLFGIVSFKHSSFRAGWWISKYKPYLAGEFYCKTGCYHSFIFSYFRSLFNNFVTKLLSLELNCFFYQKANKKISFTRANSALLCATLCFLSEAPCNSYFTKTHRGSQRLTDIHRVKILV